MSMVIVYQTHSIKKSTVLHISEQLRYKDTKEIMKIKWIYSLFTDHIYVHIHADIHAHTS